MERGAGKCVYVWVGGCLSECLFFFGKAPAGARHVSCLAFHLTRCGHSVCV